jgi:hypothetical protein
MRQPLVTSTSTARALSQCVMRIHSGWMGRASGAVLAMAVLFMGRIVGRTPWPIHHAKFN